MRRQTRKAVYRAKRAQCPNCGQDVEVLGKPLVANGEFFALHRLTDGGDCPWSWHSYSPAQDPRDVKKRVQLKLALNRFLGGPGVINPDASTADLERAVLRVTDFYRRVVDHERTIRNVRRSLNQS